ncbi:hypothetical protein MIMGU_mgv1a014711mg [Erythranthe guttata]|uniref:Secreted protein n=1 Tax=Erythranthe guttata TaxID=4155 RepID=A0A022PQT2_ERYGU|nr:hypothetical protein MIMGU_mgv1a014711mg [Erythranthe guttata]
MFTPNSLSLLGFPLPVVCFCTTGTDPVSDEEAAAVDAVAGEDDDISGVEAFLLDEAAPALGEDVALAAVPVRVPEPPRFPDLVLEPQQQPALAGVSAAAVQREMLLRVLLRYHEPVQLADVARRQRLLEQPVLGDDSTQLRFLDHAIFRRHCIAIFILIIIIEVESTGRGGVLAAEHCSAG